jgi:dihydrofolate synthase/folylpolyglutamate synthase
MTYEEALDYMYSQLPMFHRIGPAAYKPSLDNTIALCKALGNPETKLRCVHVAGTNGKGSTSHLIASSLQEAGYKVGLYTSPHLKDFRERIRINGHMIPHASVVHFVEHYRNAWEHIQPSFFEMTFGMCLWHFVKEEVDIAVIETGLGGRLDSTNVVSPEVSVITNIGFDHMNLLGDTLEKIAVEKAGIIKHHKPTVLGEMLPEAQAVMELQATAQHAPIYFASHLADEVPYTPLSGWYQKQNTKTAYTALRVLSKHSSFQVSEEEIARGFAHVLENTHLQGRWQILGQSPMSIADVAHNEDGIRTVVQQLNTMAFNQLHFVLGMVADKDVERVLKLLPTKATYYFCKANIPRGLPAEELCEKASHFGLNGKSYTSVGEAYDAAITAASSNDLVFTGGSVFTVAEVL